MHIFKLFVVLASVVVLFFGRSNGAAVLNVASHAGSCVALTFDDGPHKTLTPILLDLLKEEGVKATFFVVGYRAKAWQSVVRRAVREGHEIGNHSWDHANLTTLSSKAVLRQFARTDAVIKKIIGHVPQYVRAPYGATSNSVLRLDRRNFIGWTTDSLDWKYRNTERVASRVISQMRKGMIILMHDIHASSVAAVPAIIFALKASGYRLVTVSELLSAACSDTAA